MCEYRGRDGDILHFHLVQARPWPSREISSCSSNNGDSVCVDVRAKILTYPVLIPREYELIDDIINK